MSSSLVAQEIILRKPCLADGSAIHALVQRCPPLDLNSSYSYFLLSSHFAHTCVVAERGGEIEGFLSAYLRPDAPDTLFVWQVAVDESMRGKGVARLMLSSLLSRSECKAVSWLEATVGPTNVASRGLFRTMAHALGVNMAESEFLSEEAFPGQAHEPEYLLRIGPLGQSVNRN